MLFSVQVCYLYGICSDECLQCEMSLKWQLESYVFLVKMEAMQTDCVAITEVIPPMGASLQP